MFLEVLITLITRLRSVIMAWLLLHRASRRQSIYRQKKKRFPQFHVLYDTTKMENVATIKMTKDSSEVKPHGKVSPSSHVYNYFEVLRNCRRSLKSTDWSSFVTI